MAVAALPGSLTGQRRSRFPAVLTVVLGAVRAAVTPHKAAMARLWDMPLSLIGAASIDFAAFHLAHGWGWLVTGVSLIVVEHLIADAE